jgi:hypothetical protein
MRRKISHIPSTADHVPQPRTPSGWMDKPHTRDNEVETRNQTRQAQNRAKAGDLFPTFAIAAAFEGSGPPDFSKQPHRGLGEGLFQHVVGTRRMTVGPPGPSGQASKNGAVKVRYGLVRKSKVHILKLFFVLVALLNSECGTRAEFIHELKVRVELWVGTFTPPEGPFLFFFRRHMDTKAEQEIVPRLSHAAAGACSSRGGWLLSRTPGARPRLSAPRRGKKQPRGEPRARGKPPRQRATASRRVAVP